ncbi:hypothetical protein [Paraburkholderia saeva]|uniref:Uncharacterized protein n=1 Tax=Paraburkholderia saeva TaxID=2777537 RepID=A0A9N8X218_9BURK|nr:hypothetical protein [Paraburkholderia saeva]CAG4900775.1 hypothetical protein LMG31841_02916 [Paraburkholderia saeva]
MKKILLSVLALFCAIATMSAHAQFNPSNGFQTINNTCGTFFLQGSTYYNGQGVSVGSTLPVCIAPFSIQNSSAMLAIPAKYTNASLPACSAATTGLIAIETDGAATPVYNATATGSGSVVVEVMCNGTNWTNH